MNDEVEIYAEALAIYGPTAQIMMMLEEMAELQIALLDRIRGRGDLDLCRRQIVEELADVSIMIGQMRHMFCSEAEFDRQKKLKIDRLGERIKARMAKLKAETELLETR
ncbi:hypothetical protein SIID45300_01759 [Candidatus Magnetaquicoccaceae bacterium FCR-1]|uniref:Uncharacterized protein n=1 Tax=Candidatus Magnetaquiglobus chichijimensis TaxID=3141448 RepID=A0ABQ0C979_9PROT